MPGEPHAFLINPYGMMYEEITASSLIKIDHEGNILDKPSYGDFDYGINRAGFVLHSAIHMARPDLNAIIHTHTWAGMAVSSLACGLLPLTQTAMRFAKVAYHDYGGVVLDLAMRELVRDLGDANCMGCGNHGLLTAGATIAEAFNWMHRMELSCKAQLAAMACVSTRSTPYRPRSWRPLGCNTSRRLAGPTGFWNGRRCCGCSIASIPPIVSEPVAYSAATSCSAAPAPRRRRDWRSSSRRSPLLLLR